MTEPVITINGRQLVEGQAMAVRVAITDFHARTSDRFPSIPDDRINEAYHDRLSEVLQMIVRPALATRMPIDDDRAAQERVVSGMHAQRIARILQLAGIVPERATPQQRDLAATCERSALPVDEAALMFRGMKCGSP